MTDADLNTFVSSDWSRHNLNKPATIGPYTYATNGRLCLRVPAREHIPTDKDFPAADRLFDGFKPGRVFRLLRSDLPKPKITTCKECSGSGDHDCNCDECQESCGVCDGQGTVTAELLAVFPFDRLMQVSDLRRILALEGDVTFTMEADAETSKFARVLFKIGGSEVLAIFRSDDTALERITVAYAEDVEAVT